ncbi:hypothetical protein DPEC_G00150560 [Dallia pectoralis]|uniref:Uncharacterized protein n=1 Tax=Dallia pectoralis TaxID=75939 RepID=A0ACC2GJM9_DALPE|nr:hypothetical protein DPEC_G00150560 [Dallia pectoralis]
MNPRTPPGASSLSRPQPGPTGGGQGPGRWDAGQPRRGEDADGGGGFPACLAWPVRTGVGQTRTLQGRTREQGQGSSGRRHRGGPCASRAEKPLEIAIGRTRRYQSAPKRSPFIRYSPYLQLEHGDEALTLTIPRSTSAGIRESIHRVPARLGSRRLL